MAVVRIVILNFALLCLISCGKENLGSSPENFAQPLDSTPNKETASIPKHTATLNKGNAGTPSYTATLKVEVKTDPLKPHNERFRGDWRIAAYNIDDLGRPLGPTWFGSTNASGQADLVMPAIMFKMPIVIVANNDAFPLNALGQTRRLEAFLPANCNLMRIPVDPLTNASWRFFYSIVARRGANNWTPSNVDCLLWAKSGEMFMKTPEVRDALNGISSSPTMNLELEPLINAFQRYANLSYKTRPPICLAERRHNGGGMDEGAVVEPLDPLDVDEERFIHHFSDPDDHLSYFGGAELSSRRMGNTVSVGENGLLRTLCAEAMPEAAPIAKKEMFLRPSLIINGQTLNNPNSSYDFADQDFYGHVANFVNPGALNDLTIKSFTVRHTNGFERDHDKYEQVCSVTILTQFFNTDDVEYDIESGSGLIFDDLFDKIGDGFDEAVESAPNNTDAVVWTTSSGNQAIEEEDRWAIIFDTDAVTSQLLGLCNPAIFCEGGAPNFLPSAVEEALVIELLGHRKKDYRDNLKMSFDSDSENLFIGLRADFELNEEQSDGEMANFMTTLTYLNKKNVNRTLSLCYEAADFLTRQQIDVLLIKEEVPVVVAAAMIARSRCFSNSRSNQRWQNFDVGLWSINSHKGVNPNLIIPSGWLGPGLSYEIYVKKFDESVFKGPVTTFHPEPFLGESLEIPLLTEGDQVMFVSEQSCCDEFKVTVPCGVEEVLIPKPGVPVVLDTTGANKPASR